MTDMELLHGVLTRAGIAHEHHAVYRGLPIDAAVLDTQILAFTSRDGVYVAFWFDAHGVYKYVTISTPMQQGDAGACR